MSMKPGPTGKFPRGKMGEDDEGEIQIALTAAHGNVVIDFGKPLKWLGLDPDGARQLAALLTENAAKAEKQR